jgi:hypothetical protein
MSLRVIATSLLLLLSLACESEREKDAKLASKNPMTAIAFRASKPTKPEVYRVWGKLDNYYNYMFSSTYSNKMEDIYYSVRMSIGMDHQTEVFGYIEKKSVDGEKLFNVLKDGVFHPLIVSIGYLEGNTGGGQVCKIHGFINEYWNADDSALSAISNKIVESGVKKQTDPELSFKVFSSKDKNQIIAFKSTLNEEDFAFELLMNAQIEQKDTFRKAWPKLKREFFEFRKRNLGDYEVKLRAEMQYSGLPGMSLNGLYYVDTNQLKVTTWDGLIVVQYSID